jgi:catalase
MKANDMGFRSDLMENIDAEIFQWNLKIQVMTEEQAIAGLLHEPVRRD